MKTRKSLILFILLIQSTFSFGTPINDSIRNVLREMDSTRSIYYSNRAYQEIIRKYGNDSDEMKELIENKKRIDSLQIPIVVKIFDDFGYPGLSMVGKEYMNVAILIFRNTDWEQLKKYQELIIDAANKKEVEWKIVARYVDRIRMLEGVKQLYGTHLIQNSETGKWEILPIENEECVDVRRKEIGLEPMRKYVKQFGLKYRKKGKCTTHNK